MSKAEFEPKDTGSQCLGSDIVKQREKKIFYFNGDFQQIEEYCLI